MKRLFNISLTSRLDYSLAVKRLKMIGREFSLLKSFSKSVVLIPAFGALVFLFCTNSTPDQTTGKIVYQSYLEPGDPNPDLNHDVALVYNKEESPDGIVHNYFDESGELFTGVSKTFFTTGELYSESMYQNGLLTNSKRYNLEAKPTIENTFEYRNRVIYLRKYYVDGILKSENKFHPDNLEEFKFFYKNGNIQIEGYWDLRTENSSLTGLYSRYDSLGALTMRHVYHNGKLLEEIK